MDLPSTSTKDHWPNAESKDKQLSHDKKKESKEYLTTKSKVHFKKSLILKYHRNNPKMTASDIAKKVKTSPNYVWKVISEARNPSKDIRGRRGRIFAHGKVFYEWWVAESRLVELAAPVVNPRTGLRQVGFRRNGDPCSCQIHPNGHLIIWPRSCSWRDWLVEEFCCRGWTKENCRVIVDNANLNVCVVEGGIKPRDPGFLPKDFYLETEWGVVLARDNSPERGVLELKMSIPKMQKYLGIREITKKLEVIEQGSITMAQRQRAIEALLYLLWKAHEKKQPKKAE